MDSADFLAKSRPVESLAEHTQKVLEALHDVFALYGARFSDKEKRLVELACEYHDRGKVDKSFQEMLRGERRSVEVPHGFLSGLFLEEDAKERPELLADLLEHEIVALYTAIHYHHARIDRKKNSFYKQYGYENLSEGYEVLTKRSYSGQYRYLSRRLLFRNNDQNNGFNKILWSDMSPEERVEAQNAAYRAYVLTVGLLNRADYAASGGYPIELSAPKGKDALVRRVEQRFPTLRPAQEFMRSNRGKNVIVVAPTGSGKTEGALLWAGEEKLFYTLPMKVSANGIYRRIHDAPELGGAYGFAKYTALLHSDAASEYYRPPASTGDSVDSSSEDASTIWRRQSLQYALARRFAFPVTVSTVDQLFGFVFKALGVELNAATLKYSCVVIDEMQAYEPSLLALLVRGLKFIDELGGRYAVVTATLPKFIRKRLGVEGNDYVFKEFSSDERRHVARLMPEFSEQRGFDVELIRSQGRSGKVLVVCNTVVAAQALKRLLPEARLLHSRFIKRDRDMLEKEIIEFQRSAENHGIWIATQLVEASLDIDFDYLHTELCSADSLLQRMGRCWRSRTYDETSANVFIYDHGSCNVYDKTILARTKRFLTPYLERIFTEEEKLAFVDQVYDDSTEEFRESLYYKQFDNAYDVVGDIAPTDFTKDDVQFLLRKIISKTVIPESIYQENIEEITTLLDVLNDESNSKEDLFMAREALKEFTLSIDPHYKDGGFADKRPIAGTDIYRTRAKYSAPDFTDCTTTSTLGLGLLREEDEADAFL